MRYAQKKPVAQVLSWLAEHGVTTSRDSYQFFLRRVLNLLTDDTAKQLQVDLKLLQAIRCRLKLPLTPAPGRRLPVKAVKSFQSLSRQRRVASRKKPQVAQPPARPGERERRDETQLLRAGIVPAPAPPGMDQVRGNVNDFQSLSRADWKIINTLARGKLRVIDRKVYPNQSGRVFHLSTRVDYTRENLIKDFGLTPAEAESCFLTL